MKKLSLYISTLFLSASLWAQQAPQKMSYQAVIRDGGSTLIVNKKVGVKISVLQGSETGKLVFAETHTPTTNTNGLISIAIGAGTLVSGDFAKIDWSTLEYYIKTETDPEGGVNYSITGTSQLLSVPFALYAGNFQPGPKGDQGPKGDAGAQGPIGLTGAQGVKGDQGLQGIQGLKGDKGDAGAQGPIGLTGAQGVKGDQGIQGLKGDKGDAGDQGPIGLTGAQGVKGDQGLQGIQGLKGDKGDAGAQGPIGLTGATGSTGPKGDAGSFPAGTVTGEMKYWDGTNWNSIVPGNQGQGLTFCDGIPTWTTGGICPGKIATLDCANANNNGTLTTTTVGAGVTSAIEYTGGNSGPYVGQTLTSTGVTGLTATLNAGNFANGNGSITYTITGAPTAIGTASFTINIGGKNCTLSRNVSAPTSGYAPNVKDIDGNIYKTIYIGTQQWMGENLKVNLYNDGTVIPNIMDRNQWGRLTTPGTAYYNNDVTNFEKYGRLYNWFTVSSSKNGNKNVCPTGWHVPTEAEWNVLINYLGGANVAGSKMKEVGNTNWVSPNTDATNTSLFNGLPGAYRYYDGNYYGIGGVAEWWSTNETIDAISGVSFVLNSSNGIITSNSYPIKREGCSVRCLKD